MPVEGETEAQRWLRENEFALLKHDMEASIQRNQDFTQIVEATKEDKRTIIYEQPQQLKVIELQKAAPPLDEGLKVAPKKTSWPTPSEQRGLRWKPSPEYKQMIGSPIEVQPKISYKSPPKPKEASRPISPMRRPGEKREERIVKAPPPTLSEVPPPPTRPPPQPKTYFVEETMKASAKPPPPLAPKEEEPRLRTSQSEKWLNEQPPPPPETPHPSEQRTASEKPENFRQEKTSNQKSEELKKQLEVLESQAEKMK